MGTLAPQIAAPPTSIFSRRFMRGIVASVLLVAGVCILAFATSREDVANRDFIEYWAAGQQLVRGANPYDAQHILVTERSAGLYGQVPIIMFNPPSALFLTLPLGIVRPNVGYLLWSLFILGAWLGSIRVLWIMNGRPSNSLHFIGYFFAPASACFFLGQTSPFVLLGLTLFLYFHRTRPLLAGAALLLCALKPHLFLPFGAALLAWAVARRAYRLLAGATVAFTISCAVPLIFDPSIYTQYAVMARTSDIKAAFIPTLSELLRIAVSPNAFWLQFLPAFAGCLWAICYFRRYRIEWDWRTHGPLLMLVSLMVAPYAWFFDAIVLLPSLLYAAYRSRPVALAVLFGLLTVAWIQLLLDISSQSVWYLWPSAAWLAWYLWAVRYSPSLTSVPKIIESCSSVLDAKSLFPAASDSTPYKSSGDTSAQL